jgi:hypothetical protein
VATLLDDAQQGGDVPAETIVEDGYGATAVRYLYVNSR